MVRDIKLARNGTFDNKMYKDIVFGLKQEEIMPGHTEILHMYFFFFFGIINKYKSISCLSIILNLLYISSILNLHQ